MSSVLKEELLSALSQAGDDGFDGPNDASLFRLVEEKLEECLIQISPDKIAPEIFTVYLFIEHVFSVLTGDVRYHSESEALCREVFNSLGKLSMQLVALIRDENSADEKFSKAYGDAVRVYLNNSRKINELIAGKV